MTVIADTATSIERMLRNATPWVLRADLVPCPGGFKALLTLDPNMVKGRALQQGLADRSLVAAMSSPGVPGEPGGLCRSGQRAPARRCAHPRARAPGQRLACRAS